MDAEKIYVKLDKMAEDVAQLRIDSAKSITILDRNTKDIEEHIRRTDLIEADVLRIKAAEDKWRGALWAAGFFFGLISIAGQILLQKYIK